MRGGWHCATSFEMVELLEPLDLSELKEALELLGLFELFQLFQLFQLLRLLQPCPGSSSLYHSFSPRRAAPGGRDETW